LDILECLPFLEHIEYYTQSDPPVSVDSETGGSIWTDIFNLGTEVMVASFKNNIVFNKIPISELF